MVDDEYNVAQSGEAAVDCARIHIHEHQLSAINRLARIEGHVRGVKRMVEEGKPCPDVLIQIAAIRSALSGLGRLILEDHLKECMVEAVKSGDYETAVHELEHALNHLIQ